MIIATTGKLEHVSIDKLHPFANHPFKPYNEEKMNDLVESIKQNGLYQPIIVRPIGDDDDYEILSGHNRVEAYKRCGFLAIPAIVRGMDDDGAALLVVNTNLKQREKLMPSEKAFAYKMQLETLRRMDLLVNEDINFSSDDNDLLAGTQNEHNEKSRDSVASSNGVNRNEIQRYIRLTYLLPELLELVDQDKIPVMAGYALSFLDDDAQRVVYEYFFDGNTKYKLTLKKAEQIRAAHHALTKITAANLQTILSKPAKKRGPVTYQFSKKSLLKEYALPDEFDLIVFVHEKLREAFAKP